MPKSRYFFGRHWRAAAFESNPRTKMARTTTINPFSLCQPIDFLRGAREERRLLGGGAAGGDAFESVPQRGVAATAFVDREVALEHRALGAEGSDASLDVGPPGCGQFLRAGRQLARVMGEAEHAHAEPAELDMHIGAGGQLADATSPRGKDLVALTGIRAEADRAADMVEDDRRFGESARQID